MAKQSIPIAKSLIPEQAIKGRGAVGNMAHRFHSQARDQFDDGWDTLDQMALKEEPHHWPATQVRLERARSAISRNDSPDIAFDYAVNPYRGCEHGCIYCYARPTHNYLNLSPGLDFETQIIAKTNIAELLRAELLSARYVPKQINIGSATDCYQPIERQLGLTRSVIELLHDWQHPLSIVTKSSGVERDLDLLASMAQRNQAAVYITITTLDPHLSRILEPRAAAPYRRLRTIKALSEAGVPVGVSVAPQIPFINEDMELVLKAAWEAGARRAFYTVIRLPWELSALFRQWLEQHYPQRLDRVMARIQDMRGGQDYNSDFASRMRGQGLWADLIAKRFETATKRLGYQRSRVELDTRAFKPVKAVRAQQTLF